MKNTNRAKEALAVDAQGNLHSHLLEQIHELYVNQEIPEDISGFFATRAFLRTALLRLDFSRRLPGSIMNFFNQLLDQEEFSDLVHVWLSGLTRSQLEALPSPEKSEYCGYSWFVRIFTAPSGTGITFRLACKEALHQKSIKAGDQEVQAAQLAMMREALSLDEADANLAALAFCGNLHDGLSYFADVDENSKFIILGDLAGLAPDQLFARLEKKSRLKALQLLDPEVSDFRINFYFVNLFRTMSWNKLADSCIEPVLPETFTLESFEIEAEKTGIMHGLLRSSQPCSILLHGAPGTGKSQLARSLAKLTGRKTLALSLGDESSPPATMAAARISVVFQRVGPEDILIVDEAEPYLESVRSSLFGESMDATKKAFINLLLDSRKIRVIWIINELDGIHKSTLRRFDYLLKMPQPGVRRREKLWQVLSSRSNNPVFQSIRPDIWKTLSQRYDLSPGLIDRTITTLGNLEEVQENAIHTVIQGYLDAGIGKSLSHKENDDWCPEALNCSPSSVQILEYCLSVKDPRQRLLFHGAPGTGKTELAKQLGRLLDYEVIQVQASSILSKYVGETEGNIRDCFAQASRPRVLLLVDEIDSFLQSRDRMKNSWEITHVNEFLTGLENFKGLFVGTTNGLDRLDPAVIRRFGIKVAFDYLTPDGCRVLLKKYFPELHGDLDWSALPPLCPSDFGLASRDFSRPQTREELTLFFKAEAGMRKTDMGYKRVIGFTA